MASWNFLWWDFRWDVGIFGFRITGRFEQNWEHLTRHPRLDESYYSRRWAYREIPFPPSPYRRWDFGISEFPSDSEQTGHHQARQTKFRAKSYALWRFWYWGLTCLRLRGDVGFWNSGDSARHSNNWQYVERCGEIILIVEYVIIRAPSVAIFVKMLGFRNFFISRRFGKTAVVWAKVAIFCKVVEIRIDLSGAALPRLQRIPEFHYFGISEFPAESEGQGDAWMSECAGARSCFGRSPAPCNRLHLCFLYLRL